MIEPDSHNFGVANKNKEKLPEHCCRGENRKEKTQPIKKKTEYTLKQELHILFSTELPPILPPLVKNVLRASASALRRIAFVAERLRAVSSS